MNRARLKQDIPPLGLEEEGVILVLWQQKYDTLDIAKKLGLRERQVHSLLLRLRESGR
jgi:hypothetical protein